MQFFMQIKKTKLKSIIPYEGLASGYSFRGKITNKLNGNVRVIQLKDFTNDYSEIGEECYLVNGRNKRQIPSARWRYPIYLKRC